MTILTQTLIITGIGIGLIFIGILCLWALMELLVRFVKDPRSSESEAEETPVEETSVPAPSSSLRRKAAAAAVAVALARASASLRMAPQSGSQISNWQSARRAMDRQQNNQLFIRK